MEANEGKLRERCGHGKTWEEDCPDCDAVWREDQVKHLHEKAAKFGLALSPPNEHLHDEGFPVISCPGCGKQWAVDRSGELSRKFYSFHIRETNKHLEPFIAALRNLVPPDLAEHPEDFAPEWHEAHALLMRDKGITRSAPAPVAPSDLDAAFEAMEGRR